MKYLIEPFKRFYIFTGKTMRKEFWLFELWYFGFFWLAFGIAFLFGCFAWGWDYYFGF